MASFLLRTAATLLAIMTIAQTVQAAEEPTPCTEDAMIVFDASGSMSGNGWGYGSETAGMVSRIDRVRATLAEILPSVTGIAGSVLSPTAPASGISATCISILRRPKTQARASWRRSTRSRPPERRR